MMMMMVVVDNVNFESDQKNLFKQVEGGTCKTMGNPV